MNVFQQNIQKKKELRDKDEEIYCFDKDEEDKEFEKDLPKTSTNFFNIATKKRSAVSTHSKNSANAKLNFSKRPSSRDNKIIDKFYMPFIKTKTYNIKINNNLLRIKDDTRQSAFESHHMMKKREEIKNIGKELMIYQNPSNFFIIK